MGVIAEAVKTFFGKAPPQIATPQFGEVGFADPMALFGRKSGIFEVYNPDELFTRKGLGIIDRMVRDDQVKAALAFKKASVLAAGYDIELPETAPEDWEVGVFITDVLKRMEGKFAWKCRELLTALDYGYSVSEKIWERRDNMIVLKNIKTRKPHDFIFIQDPHGETMGLRQMGMDMPIDKFIIYSFESQFSNPYGRSDLVASYRPWWLKDNAYKWMSMLLERLGVPPIFALYNPNAIQGQTRDELKNILSRLQGATTGIIPRGKPDDLELWTPELAGQVATVFTPAIDMLDRHISRGLLMPGQLGLGAENNQVGSYAKSRTHFDVYMLIVESIRGDLEDLIQEQVIEPLVNLNFPAVLREDMPRFRFLPIKDETRVDILTAWAVLVNGKIVKPTSDDEARIRELTGMPEREASEDEEYGVPTPTQQPDDVDDEVAGNGRGKYTLTDRQFDRLLVRIAGE